MIYCLFGVQHAILCTDKVSNAKKWPAKAKINGFCKVFLKSHIKNHMKNLLFLAERPQKLVFMGKSPPRNEDCVNFIKIPSYCGQIPWSGARRLKYHEAPAEWYFSMRAPDHGIWPQYDGICKRLPEAPAEGYLVWNSHNLHSEVGSFPLIHR